MKGKYGRKKRLAAACMLLVMLTGCLFPTIRVQAAKRNIYEKMLTVVYYADGDNSDYNGVFFPEKAKVKNLKSANKKILEVFWNKNSPRILSYTCKKAGRTTISFDLVEGKKTTRYTANVVVKKYTSPCKSLKLGKKDVAAGFKGTRRMASGFGKKVKISVKPNKGWLLTTITAVIDGKIKIIKNNSTVKKSSMFHVYFMNKKTGETVVLELVNDDLF